MYREKEVKGRWQTLNATEKFFTVVIASSFISGSVLLALEVSKTW
jgi:hypothetical protein